MKPRITLHTSRPAAAQTFVDLYRELPAAAEQLGELGGRRDELKRYLDSIVAIASPQVDGTGVNLNVPTVGPGFAQLQTLLADAADAAMESTRHKKRMHLFKFVTLAMLLYADDNKHLPPAVIRDKIGQPLLSCAWRYCPTSSKARCTSNSISTNRGTARTTAR